MSKVVFDVNLSTRAKFSHVFEESPGETRYGYPDFDPNKDGVDGKYGSKTSSAVKQFKVDQNLGAQSKGSTERGVIYRLDELFPPAASP